MKISQILLAILLVGALNLSLVSAAFCSCEPPADDPKPAKPIKPATPPKK